MGVIDSRVVNLDDLKLEHFEKEMEGSGAEVLVPKRGTPVEV